MISALKHVKAMLDIDLKYIQNFNLYLKRKIEKQINAFKYNLYYYQEIKFYVFYPQLLMEIVQLVYVI